MHREVHGEIQMKNSLEIQTGVNTRKQGMVSTKNLLQDIWMIVDLIPKS